MQELRFVAVSEDGRYAVLAVPGRSARFTLPIDERLRAVALGQTSRLAQYEIEVESPLRPKEIQARIRAGETVEEIADAAGIAVERVRWFEGPVLAERAYMADQAQKALVRRQGDAIPSSPGPRLGEIVTERLKMFGADPEEAQWDARKLGDGSWQVQLTFISGGRLHRAEWIFDPRRRHVLPADENAARMSLPGTEPPQPAAPAPGEATVTHLAPRLSSAAGHGGPGFSAPGHAAPSFSAPGYAGPSHAGSGLGPGGTGGNGNGNGLGNGGRPWHERPGAGRPAVPEPQVTAPEAPEPREAVPPPVPSAPPVSPATVAAQVSRAPQGPRPSPPGGAPEQAPQPARHSRQAEESRVAQETAAAPQQAAAPAPSVAADSVAAPPAAVASPAAPAAAAGMASPAAAAGMAPPAAAASPAAPVAPSPAPPVPAPAEAPAESAGDQARHGRKAARGRRSSVPSWDEIMFGNSRQRD